MSSIVNKKKVVFFVVFFFKVHNIALEAIETRYHVDASADPSIFCSIYQATV